MIRTITALTMYAMTHASPQAQGSSHRRPARRVHPRRSALRGLKEDGNILTSSDIARLGRLPESALQGGVIVHLDGAENLRLVRPMSRSGATIAVDRLGRGGSSAWSRWHPGLAQPGFATGDTDATSQLAREAPCLGTPELPLPLDADLRHIANGAVAALATHDRSRRGRPQWVSANPFSRRGACKATQPRIPITAGLYFRAAPTAPATPPWPSQFSAVKFMRQTAAASRAPFWAPPADSNPRRNQPKNMQ